jgi:histidinol-phosphate/aromatic aminotransferase/cobyric acid decarboxylase-like protein
MRQLFRITVGTEEENTELIEAMVDYHVEIHKHRMA